MATAPKSDGTTQTTYSYDALDRLTRTGGATNVYNGDAAILASAQSTLCLLQRSSQSTSHNSITSLERESAGGTADSAGAP